MPLVPQPAKGELAMRRITNAEVARKLGFSQQYVGRVLNGLEPPSRRFRSELAKLLDLPETELFRDDFMVVTQ